MLVGDTPGTSIVILPGQNPYAGSYRPESPLSALDGGPAGGEFVLFAADLSQGYRLITIDSVGATVTYPQTELALQGRRLLSCQNGNVRMRRDLPLLVGMLEDGRLEAGPIITARYGLDKINDALSASAEKRDLTGVIVP